MASSDGITIWHMDMLPRATKKALDFLSEQTWLKNTGWYLAGGTALALQLGHRQSLDLDFFLPQKDFDTTKLIVHFSHDAWKTTNLSESTVYGILFKSKISFIAYPFFIPLLKPNWYGAVRILASRDIAVMKIIAISQRGRKRDFIDLYWYMKHFESLGELMALLSKQYPIIAQNYHHVAKSMMYFNDADKDPLPRLNSSVSWSAVKAYFQREVPRATRDFLDLN